MDVTGKVIIVTGASSGIGLAAAKLLSSKGAKLVLAARSKDKLDKLAAELNDALVVRTDMTKPEEIKNLIKQTKEHYGRVDVLINNAGQGYDAPVEKTRIEAFKQLFDIDVIGPLIAMQEVIPLMREQNGGLIMNISSGTALMYLLNMGAYSSLKRALTGLSLTAREELKRDGIIVNVVYPYITLTDFEKNTLKHDVEEREWTAQFKPDTAEYVAHKILEGIENEEAEIFAHDWMNKRT